MFFLSLLTPSVNAIEVIVNQKTQLASVNLTTYQLRQIYTMRQHYWPSGEAIVVYTLPNSHTLHQSFSKKRLKIFPYQLERIWRKLTYSGLGKVPVVVSSELELKKAVSSTPGAIGYVEKLEQGEAFHVVKINE